jgi:hypothetical protein
MQAARWVTALAALAVFTHASIQGQASAPEALVPTIRVDSSLTLVDVIAENTKTALRTRALLSDLKREDFRIFDNRREMPIESFDIGEQFTTRPIALWLIVQCNQNDPPGYHSMFIRGRTQFLKPALAHLGKNDVVGVAHWCDDGTAILDLEPGHDPATALSTVEQVLDQKPPTNTVNRPGELAMQRMIRLVLKKTHEALPERLPIFLFLYGDQCATYAEEANSISRDLLETSGMVYGINDGTWPFDPRIMTRLPGNGDVIGGAKIFYLVHYYSRETGGEVYSTIAPRLFSNALDYILTQLHLRYTIGFKPTELDGKRHELKVELTPDARKKYPAAELRYRPEYIPSANR